MTYRIEVPPVWTNIFNCLFDPAETTHDHLVQELAGVQKVKAAESRIAVFGGKSAGKSTYNKWLVNQLLQHERARRGEDDDAFVLYIDLDPGQAEFTPPGVISVSKICEPVHGPNFSHLTPPIMAKYLGSINMSDCPSLYLQCVRELFDFITQDESLKNVPWVLNTMGFLKGLGLSLTCKVVCLYNPTIVMQILMEEDNRSYSQAFLFDPPSVYNYMITKERRYITQEGRGPPVLNYQFISFDSVFGTILDKRSFNVKPKALRDEVINSYFSEVAVQTEDNNILAFPPRVTKIEKWVCDYSVSLASIGIGTMTSSCLSYDDILKAMNGNLVAFCKFSEDVLVSSRQHNHQPNKMIVNASKYSNEFYGYAIVRCIERRKEQFTSLYLTTPVPEEILKTHVNCVVTAGTIGLPTQIYLSGLGEDKAVDFRPDHSQDDPDLSYVVSKRQLKSKLNEATRKQFVPKKVSHNVLKNCLQ